jgi:hypothetical protein
MQCCPVVAAFCSNIGALSYPASHSRRTALSPPLRRPSIPKLEFSWNSLQIMQFIKQRCKLKVSIFQLHISFCDIQDSNWAVRILAIRHSDITIWMSDGPCLRLIHTFVVASQPLLPFSIRVESPLSPYCGSQQHLQGLILRQYEDVARGIQQEDVTEPSTHTVLDKKELPASCFDHCYPRMHGTVEAVWEWSCKHGGGRSRQRS